MKRGQVTLFIIIGILVIIAVSLTLYVNKEYVKSLFEQQAAKLSGIPQQIQPLEEHIKFCIEDTSKLSIKIVLLQGGYFEPKNYFNMESYDVSYWYDKKDITLQINIIEKEIANSMVYLVPGCISDFNEDYNIEVKNIIPRITIKDNKIISSAQINLVAEYKNLSYNINKLYSISYNSELKKIYDASKAIVESEKANPENIDLTFLSNLGYDINFFRFDDVVIYSVSGEELTLMFANRF